MSIPAGPSRQPAGPQPDGAQRAVPPPAESGAAPPAPPGTGTSGLAPAETAPPGTGTSGLAPAETARPEPVPPDPEPSAPVPGATASLPVVPDESGELERLRAEVTTLRARLESGRRRRSRGTAIRGGLAAVLVVLAAFALVAGVVGVWAARTTLETDRWVATVAPLPQDPRVNAAVAQYATTELFQVVDVETRLREVLPPQAAFVAGPIAGQLREQVRRTVENVLGSERFQVIWVELNRRLHQQVLAVLEGESTLITAQQDAVRIDLLPLINQVLRELSAQLPTLFGKQITLPDLSSGAIPENLRLRVEEQLGVSLPANFAQFTVYDSGQLWAAQQAVTSAKRYLALFVAAAIVLLIAAFAISPRRRRTAVQLGIWLVIAALVITVVLRAVRRQIIEAVPEGTYREGVDAAMTTVFSLLRERGTQILWIGAILALVAWLAGPGRLPVWLRGQVRRGAVALWRQLRRGTDVAVSRGPELIARYLDPIRIAGVAVAGLLALLLSSWTSLLVIVVVLVAFEVAVTLIAGRQPPPSEPPSGERSPGERSPGGRSPGEPSPGEPSPAPESRPAAEPHPVA